MFVNNENDGYKGGAPLYDQYQLLNASSKNTSCVIMPLGLHILSMFALISTNEPSISFFIQ